MDIRLGRQHIVWGEMVGLFFADVVSARDLRTFYLPEFEQLRIPNGRREPSTISATPMPNWSGSPFPATTGSASLAEFYPCLAPGHADARRGEARQHPSATVTGVPACPGSSGGWDLSGFYRSLDVAQTFTRSATEFPSPAMTEYHPDRRNDAKDFGEFVLKGEAVHARGRKFNTFNPVLNPDGLVAQNTIDYVGVDIPVREGREPSVFRRRMLRLRSRIGLDRVEGGGASF